MIFDHSSNSFILKNGTLVDARGSCIEDIAITKGIISARGFLNEQDFLNHQIIDITGKLILPGGIDPHVHLALPTPAGASCDDFISGGRAALAGGTTTLFDFVTPRRGQSLLDALRRRRAEAILCSVDCYLHMGISEWTPAVEAEILPCIENEGVRSFKAYLAYHDTIGIGYSELEALMRIVAPTGAVVMVHCEDGETVSTLQKQFFKEGKTGPVFHVLSRPHETEIRAVEKVVELSARTGCRTYIVHISTRRGAEIVGEAKRSGVPVYGETCPHYLLMDDSVYFNQSGKTDADNTDRFQPDSLKVRNVDYTGASRDDYRMLPFIISPPIRGINDQEGLWEALANGSIDVVSTDHCPFLLKGQKESGINDFTRIPNGTGGIEHRLTLLYTYGVVPGRIPVQRFVELTSSGAAGIFGLGDRKGNLDLGFDADLVVWDRWLTGIISASTHRSRSDHDIYEGFVTKGQPMMTFLHGKIVS